MSATIKLEKKHFPVMLNELISIISPLYGGTFIDCTFGQGGYSKEILKNSKNKVLAIDRDKESLIEAIKVKKKYKNRFVFENIKFSQINDLKINKENLRAIIFDLGYSLNQMKDPNKGLSFSSTGDLNMQMGLNDFSATDVVNKLSEQNIEKILRYFGEETKSKLIAKKISFRRKNSKIRTQDLVKIIEIIKKGKKTKIHNSTKVFQALRIFVNKEISELMYGLINSFKILPIGGMIIVITFHSIEDKIVKFFFKNYSQKKNSSRYLPDNIQAEKLFNLFKKKHLIPSEKELKENISSRSAKMRCAVKVKNSNNFEDFFRKFEYLIDVENLSKEL